jgi:release factor glutamine methyltransferase
MTWQKAEQDLRQALLTLYAPGEASAITDRVMEFITQSPRMNRRLGNTTVLTDNQLETLATFTERLLKHEPVQYVLNEGWFMGKKMLVNRHVLIPRPETEELVGWIAEYAKKMPPVFTLLDVGTGSGCIPVLLKLMFPDAEISGIDVSGEALLIAVQNAASLEAGVHFSQLDFSNNTQWQVLPLFDIIVSNPPYIPLQEKDKLDSHVVQWEPGLALFVPGNDPLLFYRLLAQFGKKHLHKDGSMFMECHRDYAEEVKELFLRQNYHVELRSDLSGNERMIRAFRN